MIRLMFVVLAVVVALPPTLSAVATADEDVSSDCRDIRDIYWARNWRDALGHDAYDAVETARGATGGEVATGSPTVWFTCTVMSATAPKNACPSGAEYCVSLPPIYLVREDGLLHHRLTACGGFLDGPGWHDLHLSLPFGAQTSDGLNESTHTCQFYCSGHSFYIGECNIGHTLRVSYQMTHYGTWEAPDLPAKPGTWWPAHFAAAFHNTSSEHTHWTCQTGFGIYEACWLPVD